MNISWMAMGAYMEQCYLSAMMKATRRRCHSYRINGRLVRKYAGWYAKTAVLCHDKAKTERPDPHIIFSTREPSK